jgi:hypothetical protein
MAGTNTQPTFTLNNYIDALVGYRGSNTYTPTAPSVHRRSI